MVLHDGYTINNRFIPTTAHMASVWLTVLLAIQRYVYICRPTNIGRWSSKQYISILIILICVVAICTNVVRVFEQELSPGKVESKQVSGAMIWSCRSTLRPWFRRNKTAYYNVYFWTQVVFANIGPCILLSVLNYRLIRAIKAISERKRSLMARQARNSRMSVRLAKQQRESHRITRMLLVVLIICLVVELPLGILKVLKIADHSFHLDAISPTLTRNLFLIFNLTILCSYPTTFFIYCSMNNSFRTTLLRSCYCLKSTEIDSIEAGEDAIPLQAANCRENDNVAPML